MTKKEIIEEFIKPVYLETKVSSFPTSPEKIIEINASSSQSIKYVEPKSASKLRKFPSSAQNASAKTTRFVSDVVRSLLTGRIEHELRPSAQLLIAELGGVLTNKELELLKQSFLLTHSSPHGKNIQGVITGLLKECFDELDRLANVNNFGSNQNNSVTSQLSNEDSNSHARLLGVLRDLALEFATFLERSECDGILELEELLLECHQKFQERALPMRLPTSQIQTAQLFLSKVSTAIFFDKLELILQDYLASGTDFSLVSGKVWASRYSRADYMPFLFDSIAVLEQQRPWLFDDEQTVPRIASVQVQVKAASLRPVQEALRKTGAKNRSLESLLLELRAIFGIGLNCLVKNEGELALRFFERVLTCSADALEHHEMKSAALAQKLSRVRVQTYLSCLRAEIIDSGSRFIRTEFKAQTKFGRSVFEQKSKVIRKAMTKIRYELELLGLSGLAVDIDGESHSSLEGLSAWVSQLVHREESLLLSELALALGMKEEAHSQLCSYLSVLLGYEAWEGKRFAELGGTINIELRSGAETKRHWFTKQLRCHSRIFVEEVCQKVVSLPSNIQERFINCVPLMIAHCLEFKDFDFGFGLAVAHRHLFKQILNACGSNPERELLYGMIDAEVGFRFGLFNGDPKPSQSAALVILAKNREKEAKGFYREIDRRRETRLNRAADSVSKTQALRELSNFRETQILREGIHGQFFSQEIRMMAAVARLTKKRGYAKQISSLVLLRINQRLKLNKEEITEFLKVRAEGDMQSGLLQGSMFLRQLNTESRALAAVRVLLDTSLTCAILQEEKISRFLLQQALDGYAEIFSGLPSLIESILAAQSLEEFRRRVENTLKVLEDESLGVELSIMGSRSGAELGFLFSKNNGMAIAELFDCFALASSIARRRVVPGRCNTLQRYVVAHEWTRLQNRVCSCLMALHDGLDLT